MKTYELSRCPDWLRRSGQWETERAASRRRLLGLAFWATLAGLFAGTVLAVIQTGIER